MIIFFDKYVEQKQRLSDPDFFFLFLLLTYHIGYLIFFFSVDGVILNTSKKIIRCVSVLAYLTHFLEMLPLCVNPTEYSRFFSLVRASLFFFFFPIFCLLQFFSARFFPYSLSLLADGRILHSAFFFYGTIVVRKNRSRTVMETTNAYRHYHTRIFNTHQISRL